MTARGGEACEGIKVGIIDTFRLNYFDFFGDLWISPIHPS